MVEPRARSFLRLTACPAAATVGLLLAVAGSSSNGAESEPTGAGAGPATGGNGAGVGGGGGTSSLGSGNGGSTAGQSTGGANAGASGSAGSAGSSGSGAGCLSPALGGTSTGPAPTFESTLGTPIKIDLDIAGRASNEVTAYGYYAWAIEDGASVSKTFDGVTFRFEKSGSAGSQLTSAWSKALVQEPNNSRLAGDGLTVEDGDAGAEIRLTIEGLDAGHHSLLVFLNEVADATADYAPVDVLLNGEAVAEVTPKARAADTYEASSAYVSFDVENGEDVVITFRADSSSNAKRKNVFINGLELDTPNSAKQAKKPAPLDADEHVDADEGSVALVWQAGESAVSHDLYIGESPEELAAADRSSASFRGNTTATSVELGCLSKRKTYYWRVDEIDADNQGTRGDLWYFRPRQLAFPSAEC